jgi:hypothetical protein
MTAAFRPAVQTKVIKGIELSYPDKVYPGYDMPDWSQPRDEWTQPTGPNQNPYPTARRWHPARTLHEAGVAFVPLNLLDELLEVDNSWGAGGAYVINSSVVQWALESAKLVTVETRGGVYTTEEQRARIREIIQQARS